MDKYGYIGIETLLNYCENSKDHAVTPNEFMRMKRVRMAEPHWIPFKRRKPTEEEGTAFDYIMDCKCPEDGQNILVSINIQGHEHVQYDTFYGGGGEECFLESGYELVEEATAWIPLPEPYREDGE